MPTSPWHLRQVRDCAKSVCRVVSCSFPNSIRTTQTGLTQIGVEIFPNHLHMFETPKLICDAAVSKKLAQ